MLNEEYYCYTSNNHNYITFQEIEDIIKNIEKLENQDHNSSKNDLECLEKTTVLFTSNDIKEEISKELKIKKKKINKENKKRKYLEKKSNE